MLIDIVVIALIVFLMIGSDFRAGKQSERESSRESLRTVALHERKGREDY